jgi:hypothetical protein
MKYVSCSSYICKYMFFVYIFSMLIIIFLSCGDISIVIQGCEDCPERCLKKNSIAGSCAACLKDEHCQSKTSPTKKCTPDHRCVCGTDHDCPSGGHCGATGVCVECLDNAHCKAAEKPVCFASQCVICQLGDTRECIPTTPGACGKGQQICKPNNMWEECKDYKICKEYETCASGKCVSDCLQPVPCQEGEKQCVTPEDEKPGKYKLCEKNTKGCYEYTAMPFSCNRYEYCYQGKCLPAQCPKGLTDCAGVCVNLGNDSTNCGICANKCSFGRICTNGQCEYNCPVGQIICNGVCVDLKSNNNNCDGCGIQCANSMICVDGSCTCLTHMSNCDGVCVDTRQSRDHCGTCTNQCGSGRLCANGKCEFNCPTGQTICNAVCVDIHSNSNHCGACGIKCLGGKLCATGMCICPSGLNDCNGICIDTVHNNENCGSCANKCGAGRICFNSKCLLPCPTDQTECNGVCVNTKSDLNHCGSCSVRCTGGKQCVDGFCRCPPVLTECNGDCFDTQINADNCGSCNNKCPSGVLCANGTCVPSTPTSCLAIKQTNPAASDGVYLINPDGAGGKFAFNAYCDMTISGGGWMIVARVQTLSLFSLGTANSGSLGGTEWNTNIIGQTYSQILLKWGSQFVENTLGASHTHSTTGVRLSTGSSWFEYIYRDHHRFAQNSCSGSSGGGVPHTCIGPKSTTYCTEGDICTKVYSSGVDNGLYGWGLGTAMNVTAPFDDRPAFFWNNAIIVHTAGSVLPTHPLDIGVK